jgi:hypothetical protein
VIKRTFRRCLISGVLGITLWFPSNQSLAQPVPNDAPPGNSTPSLVPDGAFYVGAGGGYNRTIFGTQNVYGIGYSNVYASNGTLSQTGSAAGPAYLSMPSRSTFAPSAQLGYFKHFEDSNWLWGGKFAYSYLGATSTLQNAVLPQVGSYTLTSNPTPVPFTGYAGINSFQTTIDHQLILAPLIGRSFEEGFIYGGAGPSLSNTQTKVNGIIGYATINGTLQNITGTPQNFSNTGWVYGGAVMVGGTYFFAPTWFLDLSYIFGVTTPQDASFVGPFTNPNGTNGKLTTGTAIVNPSGTVMTHAIMLTINKTF